MAVTTAALAAALVLPASAGAEVKAGVGEEDATWHVGAAAGQYATEFNDRDHHGDIDPTLHATRRTASYGIQSRLSARALVVQGSGGKRIAIVKNDLYIPQDLLYRRTAQLLEAGDSGITRETLTIPVSHDHSSPYYSTPSWGVWAFQDVFDIRFFDYYARKMAAAVEEAADRLKPVRVGASVNYFDKTHRHSFGPTVADDGTPAGYPIDDTDHDMTVIRFDDISDRGHPKPLANLVNFGLHPEFLSGNDLISADYVAPLERMVDRRTGALTIFTQSAVGTSEPERSTYHSIHERLEFPHREYAQAEYGARLMAESIIDTSRDIERRTPENPNRFVPFQSDGPVEMQDRWFPGPISHPVPTVSNCRTENPGAPVIGLPDCERPPNPGIDPGVGIDQLKAAGIPIPSNYSAPSYTGLEEDVNVHLQAFRIGDVLFTVCSCEQWKDQSFNIKTRTDRTQGNEWLGYDWGAQCGPLSPGWSCPDPRNPAAARLQVTDHEYQRMRAQVNNAANGWDDLAYAPFAESEPVNPDDIKGNYTHDDTDRAPTDPEQRRKNAEDYGYPLTVTIAMANDYNGYIASYREYQRGDHYRKALTGWGPHSSDYMATRLVRMGRNLNGGPAVPNDPGHEKVAPDLAHNDARAAGLGAVGNTSIQAYENSLPADGGNAEPVAQPQDTSRFGAAFLKWIGGSNFTDEPKVRVQRRSGGEWEDYAAQAGEVPVTLRFPQGEDTPSYLSGSHRWEWTAHFEAFNSSFRTIEENHGTPEGTYRFVVDGFRREGRPARKVAYRVVSREFRVDPWDGITAEDIRLERNRTVSFRVGPRRTIKVSGGGPDVDAEIGPIDYPDSYRGGAKFIRESRTVMRDPADPADPSRFEWYCLTCSFRPWIDAGNASDVLVTFMDEDRRLADHKARERGGRWQTDRRLRPGEMAFVSVDGVRDGFGNLNGQPSKAVFLDKEGNVRIVSAPSEAYAAAVGGSGAGPGGRAHSRKCRTKKGRKSKKCVHNTRHCHVSRRGRKFCHKHSHRYGHHGRGKNRCRQKDRCGRR